MMALDPVFTNLNTNFISSNAKAKSTTTSTSAFGACIAGESRASPLRQESLCTSTINMADTPPRTGALADGVGGLMSLSASSNSGDMNQRNNILRMPIAIRPPSRPAVPLQSPMSAGCVPGRAALPVDCPVRNTKRTRAIACPSSWDEASKGVHIGKRFTSMFRDVKEEREPRQDAVSLSTCGGVNSTAKRLRRRSCTTREREGVKNARRYRSQIFGYDIRLVHSLITCICEWTLSKEKVVKLNWHDISMTLDPTHRLSASECQSLWRYVAYKLSDCDDDDDDGSEIHIQDSFSLIDDSDSDIDIPISTSSRHSSAFSNVDNLSCESAHDTSNIAHHHHHHRSSSSSSLKSMVRNQVEENVKRKWTTSADVKLLKGILNIGEGNWDVIRMQCGLSKRESATLESRWRVMQRSVSAGRYKNERVVSLISAIRKKHAIGSPQLSSDVQTAADAMTALMSLG